LAAVRTRRIGLEKTDPQPALLIERKSGGVKRRGQVRPRQTFGRQRT
jgi:hypothetical protein